jgi:hypothetical protein
MRARRAAVCPPCRDRRHLPDLTAAIAYVVFDRGSGNTKFIWRTSSLDNASQALAGFLINGPAYTRLTEGPALARMLTTMVAPVRAVLA